MFSPDEIREEDPTPGVNKGGSSVSGHSWAGPDPAPALEKILDLADCKRGIMRIPACAKSRVEQFALLFTPALSVLLCVNTE